MAGPIDAHALKWRVQTPRKKGGHSVVKGMRLIEEIAANVGDGGFALTIATIEPTAIAPLGVGVRVEPEQPALERPRSTCCLRRRHRRIALRPFCSRARGGSRAHVSGHHHRSTGGAVPAPR